MKFNQSWIHQSCIDEVKRTKGKKYLSVGWLFDTEKYEYYMQVVYKMRKYPYDKVGI